ncbi:hypothetical protein, unlikely [Trypanosoma congolense IL3000]|uniref:Uncharacterized protein n=1 Tax=Trypanosoma congolense (strain IL3000) TaxID=1068625 RepID=F9WCN6_TRYCI|nr:hypothetical protein, unlikely [Trypanosoma congolense IL3000]
MFRPTASGWGALCSFFSFFFSFQEYPTIFVFAPIPFTMPFIMFTFSNPNSPRHRPYQHTRKRNILAIFFSFLATCRSGRGGRRVGEKQHKTGSKERSKFLTSAATCGGGQSVTHLHRVIYWGLSGHRHAGAAGMFSVL